MNYQKIYDNLVAKRKQVKPETIYTENHHIIPKSFGGSNDASNIVTLTAREHFIAHRLLVKINTGERKAKMFYAMSLLAFTQYNSSESKYKVSSRLYEQLKREMSKLQSVRMLGENNSFFGKTFSAKSLLAISKGGEKRRGENNGIFGKKRPDSVRAAVSKANKGKRTGESNPSKRVEVRQKLTTQKLGKLNPNAMKWKIVTPTGETIYMHGGIKRKILKYIETHARATVRNGWLIEKILEFPVGVVVE